MRLAFVAAGSVMLLSVAACSPGFSGISATGGTPAGAASTAPGQASAMPQSTNSLPAGAAVSAPIQTNTGKVGTTSY